MKISQPVQCLTTLMVKKTYFFFYLKFHVLLLVPIASLSVTVHLWRGAHLPAVPATSCRFYVPSTRSLGGTSWCSLQLGHILVVMGSPEVDPALPVGSDKSWAEGKTGFPHCANSIVPQTAWAVGNHLCCKDAPLTGVELVVHWASQVFCKAAALATLWYHPWGRTWCLHLIGFALAHFFFFQPVKILLHTSPTHSTLTTHPEVVLSRDLLKVHSLPSSKSLVKMLNGVNLSIDPWEF